MTNDHVDKSGAAIVCPFVAQKKMPIVYAFRGETTEPADSGWQFLSEMEVSVDDLKVLSISEVLEYEPSLKDFIDLPEGTELRRASGENEWHVTES